MKEAEMDSLKDAVKNVVNQFNGKLAQVEPIAVINKNQTDDKLATAVEGTSRSFDSLRLQSTELKTAYRIRKENAGIVLIINQRNFHFDTNPDLKQFLPIRRLETRHGTDQDVKILEKVFSSFGYKFRVLNNLLHTEILNAIRDIVNECFDLDSIFVCILSHGYKGMVFGANSIPVKIEDIEKLMISERLIGKPKILIVQACQGEQTQMAQPVRLIYSTLTLFSNSSIIF